MTGLAAILARCTRALARAQDAVLVVLLVVLILMTGGQILARNLFGTGMADMDSIARLLVLWLGMTGAMIASRDRKQIKIDILTHRLTIRARRAARTAADLFTAIVCGLVAWHSIRFVLLEWNAGSTSIAGIPTWLAASILPIAFTLIAVHYLIDALANALGIRPEKQGQ
jgi:TRAP-type C4-dicarboxylate transport system permease small subunit